MVKMLGSSPEKLDLILSPLRELSCKVMAILPTLSMDTLRKLLEDVIPRLLCDDTVPKVKKKVWHGESPFTEEAQRLHFIQEAIEQQIEKNIEEAKEVRWLKHIRPLIDEIERLLFPFWDYLKKHGSYGRNQNVVFMKIIRQGRLPSLAEVIRELERIKYKLEVESKQPTHEKPAETEQNIPTKRCGIKARLKKVVENAWQIFTKSFWETVFDRIFLK